MKKLAKYLLVSMLVLLLAGWLLLSVFDANRLKKPVLGWLNEHTELDLTIGRLEFNPLHPYTLLAEDVRLGDWFSARQLYLQLATLSPLSGQTRIATLDVIDGKLQLDNATELVLPDNLANITIDELNTKNLSLSWNDWQAGGADLTLSQWQPRRQGAWQWWSDLEISGQLRQLTHPAVDMSRINLSGRISQQQLMLDRVQSRLFDGLFDSALSLNLPARELTLNEPQFSHNKLQFEQLPQLDNDWTLLLNRARLENVSITSPTLTANGIDGELRYLEWQGGNLPEASGSWQAEEAVLDWLRLDEHQGQLSSSRERLGLTLRGKAYQGAFDSELRWYPQQGRLDIDNLQLQGNKLNWQSDLYWPVPDVRIHKLNLNQGELLSLDPALPLSLLGGELFIADLAWSGAQWRPLTAQARLEGSWSEMAYDSLIARHGHFNARLDDTRLLLDKLSTDALDGRVSLDGSIGLYPPHQGRIRLEGKELELRRLSHWLQAERAFSGQVNIDADLAGTLREPASWQGSLALDGSDIFIEKLGLDDWLKRRLGEDYGRPTRVDPVLAALDLEQSDGFIYRAELKGPVKQGRWQLDGSAVQSVRHLLALRGALDFAGRWQLELGAVNAQRCRELAIRLEDSWRAPRLRLHQPELNTPCQPWYQGSIPYPAAGLPGRLTEAVRKLKNRD
ncbi:AsmA-like C-terminal region-containing protein [uncultured Oceanisphaera sp.]|uniref:AsmA-like C-terminal region-containing protein n=1 Tax=uncultured Oceanisphaera sp. TaxID=353858 RepID=UPI0026384B0D|nr:AsmA-like C-terminal region-containing protein [uncultured Oceanisphaera sp.]